VLQLAWRWRQAPGPVEQGLGRVPAVLYVPLPMATRYRLDSVSAGLGRVSAVLSVVASLETRGPSGARGGGSDQAPGRGWR
jgi:hypothetical protein